MKKSKKDNVVVFPSNLSSGEREVEAILFAAAEPLEIESIQAKVSKNINVKSHQNTQKTKHKKLNKN